jgi:hypothetical protein
MIRAVLCNMAPLIGLEISGWDPGHREVDLKICQITGYDDEHLLPLSCGVNRPRSS